MRMDVAAIESRETVGAGRNGGEGVHWAGSGGGGPGDGMRAMPDA